MDPIEVIGTTFRVSPGEKVCTSSYLQIGTWGSYESEVYVSGVGASLEANGMYLDGRGSRLVVQDGGVARSSSSLSLYGDSTQGVVYPYLMNGVIVSGVDSLLDIAGNVSLWSPDAPGKPGDPLEIPREIPTFLNIYDGGTVRIAGQLSVTNGSWVNLGTDGRLEVSSMLGNLTVHGTFAPGNSPAACTVEGGLTIGSDGTLEMELGGYVRGAEFDQLTVTGLATLGGTLDVMFVDGFSPTNGASFNLFNWNGGITNEIFSATNLPALSGGLEWETAELYGSGTLSVIPEPNVIILLGVFGGGLWAFRRLFPGV